VTDQDPGQLPQSLRFCDHCDAVIRRRAAFCDECGLAMDDGAVGRPRVERLPDTPATEFFRAHMRLLHASRDEASKLDDAVSRVRRDFAKAEKALGSGARRRALALSERVLSLEEEWDELQHRYNRRSEGIEEQMLLKAPDSEGSLDIPDELHVALDAEVQAFLRDLESTEAGVRDLERRVDHLVRRHARGPLDMPAAGWRAYLAILAISLSLMGLGIWAALGILGLEPSRAALVLVPPLMAVLILLYATRPRET
jgi:hypothetical protein